MRVETIGNATLHLADCLTVLPSLAESAAGLVLTDPPYNVSVRNGRANTTIGKLQRKDGTYREIKRDFGEWDHGWDAKPFLGEALRLLRPGGSLLAFTSEFLFAPYLESGLDHRALLYWRKTNPAPNFRKQIVRAVEMAVWQTKGGSWTFNAGGYRPNVWDGPVINGFTCENTAETREHPTQKPEWLMREWVSVFAEQGDVVLDPFMGSGTSGVAAVQLGRKFIGCEINPEYFAVACERIDNAQRQAGLFSEEACEAPLP